MKVTAADLDALHAIAAAAGEAVMEVYAGQVAAWTKGDGSPLTEADLRADARIGEGLQRSFPGVPVCSEESGTHASTSAATFFLVDPLDGTKEFLKRNGEFTVNIALVADGSPVAGVVLAPALGECFLAARGLGAWRWAAGKRTLLATRTYEKGQPVRIVGSRSHGADALHACIAALPVAHALSPVGSSLKFCRVAQGEADVYPRFGPTSQWDTAAAQCVLENAGGFVLDRDGQSLTYGLDRSLINPGFVALGDRAVFAWFRPGEPG
jgi:3'(2'),5'-bisphosphate nucleotidase